VAARHRVAVQRTPVGEAHVVARMLEIGAVIGGEGNGGVILPALHPGRDALLGMALILQILAARETSLAKLVAQYPPFYMTKSKVALEGPFSTERVRAALDALGPVAVDTQDGVKAVLREGWIHLRVSNTEGLVRVIAEAPDGDRARSLAEEGRRLLHESWGKG
jgi:phosphomannomutase